MNFEHNGHIYDAVEIAKAVKLTASAHGQKYLDDHYGGKDEGPCGFAWVTIKPKHKGNTKLGREERKTIRALGFKLDWTEKAFELWNPADLGVQNVESKYAGARAAAVMLTDLGFNATARDRLD